jgi:hypothetical protein
MRRLTALMLIGLFFSAPAQAWAKAGYARPPEPKVVTAGVPVPSQFPAVLGGCGPKRVRDPVTNKCRGPADVGN